MRHGDGGDRKEWYEYRGKAVSTTRTLIKVWDDDKAEHIYFLTELTTYPTGEVEKSKQLWGNKEWAKAISKRYDLTLPKAELEA